jgi:hypothetical protein
MLRVQCKSGAQETGDVNEQCINIRQGDIGDVKVHR